jgi:hypothetical protein
MAPIDFESVILKMIRNVGPLRERYGSCTTYDEVMQRSRVYAELDAADQARKAREEAAQKQRLASRLDPHTPDVDDREGIARLKGLFLECLRRATPSRHFDVDNHNRLLIGELFFWAIRMKERTKLDCERGLLLMGGVGSGKSTLLRALAEFDRIWRPVERGQLPIGGFRLVKCREVTSRYSASGDVGLADFRKGQAAFDELGREPVKANYFGASISVMGDLLDDRYDRRLMTHLATNFASLDEINHHYGPNVADRLREMCNIVMMGEQPSRRK